MNSRKHGITFAGLCVVLFVCLTLAQIVYAGNSLTMDESADLDFFKFQGTIMEIHPHNNYLIAGEKFIELIDFQKGGKRFRTMLRNSAGEKISLKSFKRGQKVFIRGFELSDGTIKAREIYQLVKTVKTRNDLRKYSFFEKAPAWEPTTVK